MVFTSIGQNLGILRGFLERFSAASNRSCPYFFKNFTLVQNPIFGRQSLAELPVTAGCRPFSFRTLRKSIDFLSRQNTRRRASYFFLPGRETGSVRSSATGGFRFAFREEKEPPSRLRAAARKKSFNTCPFRRRQRLPRERRARERGCRRPGSRWSARWRPRRRRSAGPNG